MGAEAYERSSQIIAGGAGRSHLKLYAEVIAYWLARYDTAEIAAMIKLPESTVASWVANFRDLTFAGAA